jgi:hypothetical protein
MAAVVCIPKFKWPSANSKDYRSISLLSCIGKMAKAAIRGLLQKLVESTVCIPKLQFGFQRGYSTTQQLLLFSEHVTKGFNKSTCALFLDVEKVFNKVWYDRLLMKLSILKVKNYLLSLLQSFLHQRTFMSEWES